MSNNRPTSRIRGFYEKSVCERIERLHETGLLDAEARRFLEAGGGLDVETADIGEDTAILIQRHRVPTTRRYGHHAVQTDGRGCFPVRIVPPPYHGAIALQALTQVVPCGVSFRTTPCAARACNSRVLPEPVVQPLSLFTLSTVRVPALGAGRV